MREYDPDKRDITFWIDGEDTRLVGFKDFEQALGFIKRYLIYASGYSKTDIHN